MPPAPSLPQPADATKLGLGTVQWGMAYGIANADGQPQLETVRAMLGIARAHRICVLDTAHSYGSAESVIGALAGDVSGFRIVTKTKPLAGAAVSKETLNAIAGAFAQSRHRLQGLPLAAVMVHHVDDLLAPEGERIWALLQEWKGAGWVERAGVSVYSPDQARRAAERFDLDIIQVPFNLYDQRFLRSGAFAELKGAGIEVHVRSAFLQGLLFLTPERLPSHFAAIRAHHARFHESVRRLGATPLATALHFCLRQPDVDHVIVGCETAEQLREIVDAANNRDASALVGDDLHIDDEAILNPSLWAIEKRQPPQ